MRSYNETDEDDIKNIQEVKAQPWQVELLKLNPSYTFWGPHEDYMWVKGDGWNSPIEKDGWADFKDWKLDDYNECVNFYFELTRKSENCSCGDGYHPNARSVVDSYYNHRAPNGIGWKDKITEDEYEALLTAGRVGYVDYRVAEEQRVHLTLEQVNEENSPGGRGMGHDCINQSILIEARLKRLGIERLCNICDGKAYNYVEDFAKVNLVLWMLHPRKGASRGVEIKNIQKEDLPEIFAYLREAAMRNANRFSKIPE